MTDATTRNPGDPLYHTGQIKDLLRGTMDHLREDIAKVDDPQARALFKTSAEVLGGLVTACEHYEQKSEPAWR
jgi:hypothetical protein